MIAPATQPGFANPVEDSQRLFRAVLQALSRPGLPQPLPVLPPPLPAGGLNPGMLAVALCLCDGDTPLWLDAAADNPQARRHLRFHCAAPVCATPDEAAFAFIADPLNMPRLRAFAQGLPQYPDRSATLVVATGQGASPGPSMRITGPGVKGNDRGQWLDLTVRGLPDWFWDDWDDNLAAYPLGVDVIFVDEREGGVCLLGLPRTSRVVPARNVMPSKEDASCMSR